MRAIQVCKYGGDEQLRVVELPRPYPGPGQVLVRIAAAAFNPVDRKLVSGAVRESFRLKLPFIPGGDFCGTVHAVGKGAEWLERGDQVFGHSATGGAYAEFIAIDAEKVALKPRSILCAEAASLALVGQTGLQMLEAAKLRRGQKVLIHGAAGGVGSIAVQIAHRMGLHVICTASSASFERLRVYGAHQLIDYTTTRFEDCVNNVDAVLDTVGGSVQQRSYSVLKPGGSLISIVQVPSQSEAEKHRVTARILITEFSTDHLNAVARLVDGGEIRPCVARIYPLSEASRVWGDTFGRQVSGKIVFMTESMYDPHPLDLSDAGFVLCAD
jgi:NADPH:quinone reductase-like Zn-dependent oxidoreductase